MNNADMIVDLQYGSTGKGLIAGFLAKQEEYDVVMSANMPNAGHTYIDSDGNEMIHKVLPNGVVSPKCRYAMIGPGAVYNPDRLMEEMDHLVDCGYDLPTIIIHPNAVILQNDHVEAERKSLDGISSTMQGSATAMVHKIMRQLDDNPTAGANKHNTPGEVVTHEQWNQIIQEADNILMEGAQGFSLGINERFYPYCTSRDCTPARFMADMGVPLPYLRKVIGTARVHPIRVGSTPDGYSGPFYEDQVELAWDDIGIEPERTTVTQRVRRVFSFSKQQIKDAIWATQPNEVFLNFCNYDVTEAGRVMNIISEQLNAICNGRMRYTGWGPTGADVRVHSLLDPCDRTKQQIREGKL